MQCYSFEVGSILSVSPPRASCKAREPDNSDLHSALYSSIVRSCRNGTGLNPSHLRLISHPLHRRLSISFSNASSFSPFVKSSIVVAMAAFFLLCQTAKPDHNYVQMCSKYLPSPVIVTTSVQDPCTALPELLACASSVQTDVRTKPLAGTRLLNRNEG